MRHDTMSLPPPDPAPLRLSWPADAPARPDVRVEPADAAAPPSDPDTTFAAFYRDAWDQVARGLAATIGDRGLATEATDEAMARAYERWATVSRYDFPAGWVYRVGLNWARSHHRRLARALPLRREEPAELGAVADPAVRAALLDLPVKLRAVVVCRLLLDWSVDETADALHIPPGTVKSRLSRALHTLEATLGHLR